jgi:hypothetical protein
MRIRRFRPRVVFLVTVVAYLALTASLEAAQKPTKPSGTIAPPQRVAEIKFLKEKGLRPLECEANPWGFLQGSPSATLWSIVQ